MMPIVIAAMLLAGAVDDYTIKVLVQVPQGPRSSYLAGCLVALSNAAKTNAAYHRKLNSKVYMPVLQVTEAADYDQSCTDALMLIGPKNADNRMKLEGRTK